MTRHLQRFHPESYMEWRRHRNSQAKRSENSDVEVRNRGNKKSCIWLFFDNLDNMAICKLCGFSMKRNMSRHLHNKHPTAHKNWQIIRRKNNEFTWLNEDNPAKFGNTRGGWIKQYIKRTGINKFRCEVCRKILKMPTGYYSSMKRHFRLKHPDIYDQKTRDYREAKTKKSSESEENKEGVIEYVVEYIDPVLDSHTITNALKSQDNELNDTDENPSSCQSNANTKENYKYEESKYSDGSDYADCLHTNETLYDPLIEGNIKRICTQDVGEKLNPVNVDNTFSVWVKQYIREVGSNKYRCELCYISLEMPENDYSNVKRHFCVKHPYIYDQEMIEYKHAENKNITENDKSSEEDVKYVVEYIDNDTLIDESDLINSISKHKENKLKGNEMNPISSQKNNEMGKGEDDQAKNSNDSEDTDDDLQLSEILRKNDPLLEHKIKQLCNKQLGDKRQRNKTCFWNFFDILNENHLYRCMFCGKHVAIYPKSISNLKRHLEHKHLWQYNLILKYAPGNDTCKTTRTKQTKKRSSVNSSKPDLDILDRDSLKCKICEEMVKCGNDKTTLIDHFVEEHSDMMVKCNNEDLLNAREYKVIIDADNDSFIVDM